MKGSVDNKRHQPGPPPPGFEPEPEEEEGDIEENGAINKLSSGFHLFNLDMFISREGVPAPLAGLHAHPRPAQYCQSQAQGGQLQAHGEEASQERHKGRPAFTFYDDSVVKISLCSLGL